MSRQSRAAVLRQSTSASPRASSEGRDISTTSDTAPSTTGGRPQLPSIPASIEHLWRSGIIEEYIDGQFRRFVERPGWFPGAAGSTINPLTLQRHVADDLKPYLRALQDYLAPGDQTLIAMRIEALLSHWSVPERPEEIANIVAGDWVRVIGSYPTWTVIEAANHWVEWEDRKPTIAAIKRLCDEAVYEARLRLRVLSKIEGVT